LSATQIPDTKSGEKRIDAVVVDEDAVGSLDRPGCGAKILYGDGAFDLYLSQIKVRIANLNHCLPCDVAECISRAIPFTTTNILWTKNAAGSGRRSRNRSGWGN
jgi:ATP-dependent Clp protease ATP-binding subunit ClpX